MGVCATPTGLTDAFYRPAPLTFHMRLAAGQPRQAGTAEYRYARGRPGRAVTCFWLTVSRKTRLSMVRNFDSLWFL